MASTSGSWTLTEVFLSYCNLLESGYFLFFNIQYYKIYYQKGVTYIMQLKREKHMQYLAQEIPGYYPDEEGVQKRKTYKGPRNTSQGG